MSLLLSTDPSKRLLSDMLEKNDSGVILTAFFSNIAYDWLKEFEMERLNIVVRGRVSDFKSGASSIKAVKNLVNDGYTVKIHLDLHAKLFWLGENILLGSSNLTGHGLNLTRSGGNVELNTTLPATSENIKVINNILEHAVSIDSKTVEQMETFLTTVTQEANGEFENWPETVLSENLSILKVSDLPQASFDDCASHDVGFWGEIARLQLASNRSEAENLLKSSKIYKWLLSQVETCDKRGINFGKVSSLLHDQLDADPALFRKEIKLLQQNLFSFLNKVSTDIRISIPSKKSQVLTKI